VARSPGHEGHTPDDDTQHNSWL